MSLAFLLRLRRHVAVGREHEVDGVGAERCAELHESVVYILHIGIIGDGELALRDVKVVCAPVSVVAGADVVVEAPEHHVAVALVDSARGEVLGVRTPLGRAEPHVPVHIGIRRPLRRGVLRDIEETHRVGRATKLLPTDPIVRVHVLQVADASVAHDHHCGAELRPAALHRTGLEYAPVLLLGGHHLARFIHAERQGLLAVHVLAVLHGLHGHVCMPVVRRRDAHHVYHRVFDDIAEIGASPARGVDLLRCVVVVDALDALREAHLVAVAYSHYPALVVQTKEFSCEIPRPEAVSDDRNRGLLPRLEGAHTDLRGRASGEGSSRRRAE